MFNEFTFYDSQTRKDMLDLRIFLLSNPSNYNQYENWVEKAMVEIESGYKHAVLATYNRRLVGNVIFQNHKTLPRVREIKNLRTNREVRGRGVAEFLIRQAEVYERKRYDTIIGDAREDNKEIFYLMTRLGYNAKGNYNLYDHQKDVLFMKERNTNQNNLCFQ